MEIWLTQNALVAKRRQNGALPAFEALLDDPEVHLLIIADQPEIDLPQLKTMLRLAEKLGIDPTRLRLATPYPARSWIAPLVELGLSSLTLLSTKVMICPSNAGILFRVEDLIKCLCPRLGTKTVNGKTASLCIAGRQRIVLADYHLNEWCLKRAEGCPHLGQSRLESDL